MFLNLLEIEGVNKTNELIELAKDIAEKRGVTNYVNHLILEGKVVKIKHGFFKRVK